MAASCRHDDAFRWTRPTHFSRTWMDTLVHSPLAHHTWGKSSSKVEPRSRRKYVMLSALFIIVAFELTFLSCYAWTVVFASVSRTYRDNDKSNVLITTTLCSIHSLFIDCILMRYGRNNLTLYCAQCRGTQRLANSCITITTRKSKYKKSYIYIYVLLSHRRRIAFAPCIFT